MSWNLSDRIVAACGLFYPVLTVIGFAAFPAPPGGDVSAAHDPQWLAAHTGSVIAQSYVRAIAAIGFMIVAIALARFIGHRNPSGRSAVGAITVGGATCGAMLLAAQAVAFAAALAARDNLEPSVIRALDHVNAALLDMSSLPAVLMFAAAGVALLHQSAPRWLSTLTLLGAPLGLVDALSYDGGPFAAVGILGLAYFLVWTLISSTYLSRLRLSAAGTDSQTGFDL